MYESTKIRRYHSTKVRMNIAVPSPYYIYINRLDKSPGYYNQYPGDHLFYLLIYLLKCGGLQIHRNRRGANVSKY